MRSPSHARSRDEGAAAVEFALLFPIFMVLALGTMAAGTAYNKQINITQAAREASRYGATYDVTTAGGIDAWLTKVEQATRITAGAQNNPVSGFDYICVAYVEISDPSSGAPAATAKSKYRQFGATPTTGAGACPSTSVALIRGSAYVQVAIARNSSFFVLFANPTIQLDALSVTPYEARRI